MSDNLVEIARTFFDDLEKLPAGKEELNKFDRKVEFELIDDRPFTAAIRSGKVSVTEGITEPPDMAALRFKTSRDVITRLFNGKIRFTDAYTHMVERDPGEAKKRLYVREQPGVGGTSAGVLVRWVARLIRLGQELP